MRTTKERLDRAFDSLIETLIGDKERIIQTMLDRCTYAEIIIPFEPNEAPHYKILFNHIADSVYD